MASGLRPHKKQAEHMNEPDRFSIAIVRIFCSTVGRPHMKHNQASDATHSKPISKTVSKAFAKQSRFSPH
ncbi:MAG: hypothetical protein E5W25_13835 [Mesorhizobium sp.]|nr:MAG: hypothetical protein E5W25_13835 [Mesorhizobium sp.]